MPAPQLRPGFLHELEELAQRGGHFFVRLSGAPVSVPKREYGPICRRVVAPLLERASECWLFQQPENALLERFRPNLTPVGRRYAVALDRDVVTGFESFWGAELWQRGSLAWQTAFEPDLAARVFAETLDPGFLSNVRTVAGPPAVRYARATTQAEPAAVVWLLAANRGLCELYVFAGRPVVTLLGLAFEHSRKSQAYLVRYSQPL